MNSLTYLNTFSSQSVSYDDQGLGIQTLANRYQINGLLDTSVNVFENIEKICSASGSWLSYDIHEGKWGVIINTSGTSIASFNDTNILSSISINGTGLTDLYNSVKVEFPHRDLRDSGDFVTIEIPAGDRNANEEDNALNLSYDIINEPIQAQLLGFIELKQSRIDLVINFETDFSYINIKAGDIIDVTNSRFGFNQKLFRVISTNEVQDDNGAIRIQITALEYDPNVYSTADLYRYTRTDENGIITIGSIGIPGTPQVTKFESDSRPRIIVETTAPTGVVEGIEFWLTEDTLVSEENRSYKLIASIKPTGGGVFTSGVTVTLDYDSLTTGDFIVKTRGFNSTTVGPYSTPSGIIDYNPQQVTDAIGPSTVTIDETGSIINSIATYLLVKSLNNLFDGAVSTGSIFSKIFELFEDVTGVDLVEQVTDNTLVQVAAVKVEDEGTELTTTTGVLNFVGEGVQVTNTGSRVTINISGTNIVSINDLSDVDTATNPPLNGDHFYWDGTNWIPDGQGASYLNNIALYGDFATAACDIDGFIAVGRKTIAREIDQSKNQCGGPIYYTATPAVVAQNIIYRPRSKTTSGSKFNVEFTGTQALSKIHKYVVLTPQSADVPTFSSTASNLLGYHGTVSTGTVGSFNSLTLEYDEDPGNINFITNVRFNLSAYSTSTLALPTGEIGLKDLIITNTTGTNYSLTVSPSAGILTYSLGIAAVGTPYGTFGATPYPSSIDGYYSPVFNNYTSGGSKNLSFTGTYAAIQSILQGGITWNSTGIVSTSTTYPDVTITYTLTIDGVTKEHTEILRYLKYNEFYPLDRRFTWV